ncbi:MAG: RagB/SusD family nutrient uptake outer membrane protein [Polyangiaceae bacterium]
MGYTRNHAKLPWVLMFNFNFKKSTMTYKFSINRIITAVICLILFAVASCKKDLYDGPIGSTYEAKFWESQGAAEQAAVSMYGQLRSCLRSAPAYNMGEACHFIFGDLAAGVFMPGGSDIFISGIRWNATPPFNFSYVPYGESTLQNWSRFYQVIAQSNLILQNVPKMSSALFANTATRNSYLGEALFMRAYTYFYITRVWGDPVYVSKTYNDVDYGKIEPLPRTPENIVLDSCLIDLKTAESYMSYAGGDVSRTVRANKGSVEALIAHIYAWKHQYDSAHVYCQKVINNGGYTLEPMSTYTNIWKGQS